MRFWRHLVKNKLQLIVVVSFAIFALSCATNNAQLPEYKKLENVNEVPKISVADAKKAIDDGTAVIVDSREPVAYKHEHIKGSINIPVGSPATSFEAIPSGKKVIVYCSCGSEGTSMKLAFEMNKAGIANTYALQGGTAAWHSAGYPMEKGH